MHFKNIRNSKDAETFQNIVARDNECKKCFECQASTPMWAVVTHGIFVCISCAGQFRCVGTHQVVIRSVTLDSWSNDFLRRMEIGGNSRARNFFAKHNAPKINNFNDFNEFRTKYGDDVVIAYRKLLDAELSGRSDEFVQDKDVVGDEDIIGRLLSSSTSSSSSSTSRNQNNRSKAISATAVAAAAAVSSTNINKQEEKRRNGDDILDELFGTTTSSNIATATTIAATAASSKQHSTKKPIPEEWKWE